MAKLVARSCVLLFLLVSAIVSQKSVATIVEGHKQQIVDVLPSNANLTYMGRWSVENADAPWAAWQGSSVSLNFSGTDLFVTLDAGSATEYFRVVIDGNTQTSRKIAVKTGRSSYLVASNLTEGVHFVELIKETYEGSNATFFGFSIRGAGAAILPPSSAHIRKMEFYGDSNLAGQSLESERDEAATSLRGSFFGYAGITARMFDASYHNISVSGETISSLHKKYDRLDWHNAKLKWDFSSFTPDAVVVNLGANDVGKDKAEIKSDYHKLLNDLRAVHPDAHIVLFNAFGWDYNEPANYTHEVIEERSDSNMSVAVFPWVFEQFHGCEYDHAGMATVLAAHLQTVLGWEPNPSDVMSGFGKNGNVANGSFEEAAPFGGYAWRYDDNQGVSRIKNSAKAYHGAFFMKLTNQAEIHQPNPANNGNEVTIRVWLRGDKSGDQAKLTIDFRDQKIWTSPLQSESKTIELTTSWQQYTMSATAPSNAERPVFHTRVTVGANRQTDGVNVDNITMTIN